MPRKAGILTDQRGVPALRSSPPNELRPWTISCRWPSMVSITGDEKALEVIPLPNKLLFCPEPPDLQATFPVAFSILSTDEPAWR